MKLAELFVALGFDVDDAKLKKFNDSVKSLRRNLIETTAVFSATIYGLDRFVNGTVQGVAAMRNFNMQTGLSIEKLQQWQQAAQLSNLAVSAESVAGSIQNLQRSLAEIQLGRGNASPFTMLGIDVNGKDAFKVLEDVRARIGGIDNNVAGVLLQDMGLDPAMLSVLRLSNQEFEKLGRNTFLSAKGRDVIDAVGKTILSLKLRLIALKDQAVLKLAPELNKLVSGFFGWLNKNHSKVIDAISGFVKVFSNFANAITRAIGLMAEFAEKTLGVENGLKFIGLAFGALTLAARPFLLNLFLIIGLLEDIAVWKKGGKSAFGGFYEAISGLITKMKPLKDSLVGFKDVIKNAFDFDEDTKKNLSLISTTFEYLGSKATGTLLGAYIGYKVGGIRGAAIGGGIALGGQVLNDTINAESSLMKEFGNKRIGGRQVTPELWQNYQNSSPDKKVEITNDIKVYVESQGDAGKDGTLIGQEIINAMHNQGNGFAY